jgi:two-component system chemotaxis response regulator CheB
MSMSKLRVLVVDDTTLYRRMLSDLVESTDGVELGGTAHRGDLAIQRMEKTPIDVVLLSLEMPQMEGLDTLREIRKTFQHVSVAMLCHASPHAATARLEALRMGAVEFIEKAEGVDPEVCRAAVEDNVRRVLKTALIRRHLGPTSARSSDVVDAADPPAPLPAALPVILAANDGNGAGERSAAPKPRYIAVVAIGISTGGPEALLKLIPALPKNLRVPILLVQHMPPLFTASLAQELDRKSQITVKEAVEGEPLRPGTVFIAPGGRHMIVRSAEDASPGSTGYVIGLNDDPPENSCRPAVDVLFRSIAAEYHGNVLAVVMTGMGSDGCEGVRAMQQKGCYCLTQSSASCVVYGMPLAVDEAGLSDESVPLHRLAAKIVSLVEEGIKS